MSALRKRDKAGKFVKEEEKVKPAKTKVTKSATKKEVKEIVREKIKSVEVKEIVREEPKKKIHGLEDFLF